MSNTIFNTFFSVLWYAGMLVGIYFLAAVTFLLVARLEKDKDGILIIDPRSLHYRACSKCYDWRSHTVYDSQINDRVPKTHVEYYQIGLCGYFWRTFWAFVLLPIGYSILFGFQTVKTIFYAPFMFLFGYYPWPTLKSMKIRGDINAVEARRIPLPRIGKLEFRPYLVVLPALYVWAFWQYPDRTLSWSMIALGTVIMAAVISVATVAFSKVQKSENPEVVLIREYAKATWQGVCPRLKVKQITEGA